MRLDVDVGRSYAGCHVQNDPQGRGYWCCVHFGEHDEADALSKQFAAGPAATPVPDLSVRRVDMADLAGLTGPGMATLQTTRDSTVTANPTPEAALDEETKAAIARLTGRTPSPADSPTLPVPLYNLLERMTPEERAVVEQGRAFVQKYLDRVMEGEAADAPEADEVIRTPKPIGEAMAGLYKVLGRHGPAGPPTVDPPAPPAYSVNECLGDDTAVLAGVDQANGADLTGIQVHDASD